MQPHANLSQFTALQVASADPFLPFPKLDTVTFRVPKMLKSPIGILGSFELA